MQVARHDFLTDAAFAGDKDRGVGRRHLVGQFQHRLHGRIVGDQRARVVRHSGENRGDQLGVGRQGNKFLGPGSNGEGRLAGVRIDAAGDDLDVDMFAFVGLDQRGDVELVIDHQQVRALAFAQRFGRLGDGFDVRDLGTRIHGHLDGDGELTAQFAYNK